MAPTRLDVQALVRRERASIDAALRYADAALLGAELALDDLAEALGFDAGAGRRLAGATRWHAANVEPDPVVRGTTCTTLKTLAQTLEKGS